MAELNTYGDLKKVIKSISKRQKLGKLGDVSLDVAIGLLPGGDLAKTTFDFVKAAFFKPDNKKTKTWLDKIDVDDEVSAIVDDTVENDFLKTMAQMFDSEQDDKPLEQDFNMNQKMVDYLKDKYEGRTVTGIKEEKSVFDKFFQKYAYKFDKGYPDMNNEQDINLLNELLNNLLEDEEEEIDIKVDDKEEVETKKDTPQKDPPGGSESYNDTIRNALYGEEWEGKPIPTPSKKYPYANGTFTTKVAPADKKLFTKLYQVKPPKVGKPIGSAGSLAVGNGEIALYWLYHFSKSAQVEEGREGDDPDLKFNGNGVEVKSWDKHAGIFGLGRFGADKENLQLLSIIFGFNAIASALGQEDKVPKTVNPTNFKGPQLVDAMRKVSEFRELVDGNDDLVSQYPLFKSIKNSTDLVYSKLNLSDSDSPEEMARKMAINLLEPKLDRKPGDGNHLVNVKSDGDMKFFQIDFDKLKNSEDLLTDFIVKQSAIGINFDKIWG